MNTIFLLCFGIPLLAASPIRVVCFGDSTTAPRKGVVPYCEQLSQEFPVDQVAFINRGVPGNTTVDARNRVERDVLQENPDLVFVQFGINDSSVDVWKKPPATSPRVSLSTFRENLASFIEAFRKRDIRVVLMTFNPLAWSSKTRELYGASPYDPSSADGFNLGRSEYLETIRSLARESDAILLDVNAAFREHVKKTNQSLADLLLDGIHPNSAGQKITAELARPIIRKTVKAHQHAN